MKKITSALIAIIMLCSFNGCAEKEQPTDKEEISIPTDDIFNFFGGYEYDPSNDYHERLRWGDIASQSRFEHNTAVVQGVDGYTERQAKSLATQLEYLTENERISNGEISLAKNFIYHGIDISGKSYEHEYLYFETADGEFYYTGISQDGEVYVIFKGPIENNEFVWAVIE